MRKVIYSMMVSLDGFIEGPNRELERHIIDEELHTFLTLPLLEGRGFSRPAGESIGGGWTPALPDLLYAMGLPGLNHPSGSGMVRRARRKQLPYQMIERLTARVKTRRLAAG